METKQSQCIRSASGNHEMVFYEAFGETCKHCGMVRDETKPPKQQVKGNPTGIEVPDALMDQVLKATKSKAAIIISLDKPIIGSPFILQSFHISAANVDFANIRAVLGILFEATSGRISGDLRMKSEEVCECGGKGYFIHDFNDPNDPHGHGQSEERCLKCRPLKPEEDDDRDR